MQIAKNKVVTIDYTLTDTQGTVLDRSSEGHPLTFIQGIGSLIPGLEAALEGKSAGDRLNVRISPDEGYGPRDEKLMQTIPRDLFKAVGELKPGMQFEAQSDRGAQVFTIVRIEGTKVTVDSNHPLAGVTLHFDVTIREVREAAAEELQHGHAHGPDTHH